MILAFCSRLDSWLVPDLVVLTAASCRVTAASMAVLSVAACRTSVFLALSAALASERKTPATTLSALLLARMSVLRITNSCPRPTWFR